MSLSDLEFQLGQLALARGFVDLFGLLECTSEVAREEGRTLEESLVESGALKPSEVSTLRKELGALTPGEFEQVVDEGETVALQSLAESKQDDRETLREKLVDPVEVAETLMKPPDGGSEEATGGDSSAPNQSFDERGDRYEIVEELGRGGMGQILRARDRFLDREIALKTLLPNASVDEPRQQLVAEAQLTGKLEHPSIVPVYELGRLPNDRPYYTMRVVPEHSLRATIEELREGGEDAPSMLHLAQILRQICLAVQFAHENGVVHRDIKPENILLGEYGEVFVIDWGIAKVVDEGEGLTTGVDDEPGSVVGTPAYMAPEQAQGHHDEIDGRTDIYAIGAVLYELLTLTPVFSNKSVIGLLMTIVQDPPQPPSKRAPDRSIPEPLEEICLRAISKEPGDRYPSAQALADELGLYIEGVKDRERDEQRARELIDEARNTREEYDEARRRLEESIRHRDELRRAVPGWADQEERSELWALEERVERLEIEVERKFGDTTRLLSQSLGHTSLDEAHDALAAMYWDRFIDAERRDDRQMAAHFENLVRQHDTGAFTRRLRGRADITVDVDPEDAELKLYRVEERDRRLVAGEEIGESTSPLVCRDIDHGQYRLVAMAPEHTPVQMPIALDRLESRTVELRLPRRETIPDDFVFIPGGEFLTGPPGAFGSNQESAHLPDYAIQRTPVTCGEYLEFLNDLAADDLEEARRYAPRTGEDAESYFPIVDGRFVIPEEDAEGDAWQRDWPICIVNYHDATAYAAWRSERDGRDYRLPTSDEWEKAARGVDGRLYPWGSHFDPSFCRMRETTKGKPMPAPVGSYRADVSPYGVLDMAGNICEWTCTPADDSSDGYRLRGGGFSSVALTCRLHWHQDSPPSFRLAHYGFRLGLELSDRE